MIRCKLIEYISEDSESIARIDRAVIGDNLTLGRAAACKIYLPDPRVKLDHATIARAEDGFLYVHSNTGVVLVDGAAVTAQRLVMGQSITIASYDFKVEALRDGPGPAQAELSLSFTHRAMPLTAAAAMGNHTELRPSWVNRRSLSWLAIALAGIFLLGLPVWLAYQPGQPVQAATAKTGAAPVHWTHRFQSIDTLWNPGPISSAHRNIAQNCRACHDKPFVQVEDQSCTACHKNTGAHISGNAGMQAVMFENQRCASCHREHQGEDSMKKVAAQSCESCHSDIKKYAPDAKLKNVGDFENDHPAFRLSMKTGKKPTEVQRLAQTPQLKEASGLKFTHALHLDKKGVKSPDGPAATGGRVQLECDSCHALDSAKVRYEPVTMEKHCSGCHRLSVEVQDPGRQVPHAKPEVVMTALRDIYAALAVSRFPSQLVTMNSMLQRPQAQAAPVQLKPAALWVEDRTLAAAKALFESSTGTCLTCHEIEKSPGTANQKWTVQPVLSTLHWLPKSQFTHLQHSNASCESCHKAAASKSSSDILIPPIETCRDCHASAVSASDTKVPSRCESCHDFHGPVVHPSFDKNRAVAHKATP
ncbi:MAG: FHA domain-containing protein [Burkholderiaceae bacterium]